MTMRKPSLPPGLTRRSLVSMIGATAATLYTAAGVTPAVAAKAARAERNGRNLDKADLVVVSKSDRSMRLLRNGETLSRYRVALGWSPTGHKTRRGDGRTPEGAYILDWRNPQSRFHLSIHISYPNRTDMARASQNGTNPGGYIMIHGLPNDRDASDVGHPHRDWTDGCIAVTDEEMDEVWAKVDNKTGIMIFP